MIISHPADTHVIPGSSVPTERQVTKEAKLQLTASPVMQSEIEGASQPA